MSGWCGEREAHGLHAGCDGWPPPNLTPCPSCRGRWYVAHRADCPDGWTAAWPGDERAQRERRRENGDAL